jgi:hypothetical protein
VTDVTTTLLDNTPAMASSSIFALSRMNVKVLLSLSAYVDGVRNASRELEQLSMQAVHFKERSTSVEEALV